MKTGITVEGIVVKHDGPEDAVAWWAVHSEEAGVCSDAMLEAFHGERVRWTIESVDEDGKSSLEDQLVTRLREWFRREAPRIKDERHDAQFSVVINFPQGDEDGTLYLDARITETNVHEEIGGRVPGVKFE